MLMAKMRPLLMTIATASPAGIHVGMDALADLPISKLRKQLDVNLIAQVSVTQVGQLRCFHLQHLKITLCLVVSVREHL